MDITEEAATAAGQAAADAYRQWRNTTEVQNLSVLVAEVADAVANRVAPLIAAQALRSAAEEDGDEEWGLRYKTGRPGTPLIERFPGDGGHVFGSREEARAHIAAWRAHFPQLLYVDVQYARRVTWTGPWEDAGAEGAPCPTCSGPTRETVGMVCQTCGTDYAKGAP